MQRELRRNQNTLRISGIGIIALSLWSILKTVLYFTLDFKSVEGMLKTVMGVLYDKGVAIILIFFFMIIDLILRAFVGLRARREGKGKKCGSLYLVIDAFLAAMSVYNIVYYFKPDSVTISGVDSFVSVIFELTTLYTCVSILLAAIRARKITGALKGEA